MLNSWVLFCFVFLELGIPDIHQAKQTYAEYLLK